MLIENKRNRILEIRMIIFQLLKKGVEKLIKYPNVNKVWALYLCIVKTELFQLILAALSRIIVGQVENSSNRGSGTATCY